jgi:hypothetical protein
MMSCSELIMNPEHSYCKGVDNSFYVLVPMLLYLCHYFVDLNKYSAR